jgi:hypothetical protein
MRQRKATPGEIARYALERLLYKLSISTHRNQFVLKGAMLVTTWFDDPIREQLEYGCLRLRTTAAQASARISITVDIGFGDAVEPGVEDVDLPVLLDLPAPRLRTYAR